MRTLWLLAFLFLIGCDSSPKEGAHKVKSEVASINVHLGTPLETLIKQSPIEFVADCLSAVDMCWYEINREGKDQALLDVIITQPKGRLELNRIVALNIVADGEVSKDVEEVEVTLRGLPDNSTHEGNRVLVYELINTLKKAGWQKYYFPSDPRIPGSQLSKFDWSSNVFGRSPLSHPLFDPDREMSLDQWKKAGMFYDWYLYSGDYLAHVKVLRNSTVASEETGVYLIKVEFMSLDTFWRASFEEKDRPRWKELFPAHLETLLLQRSQAEAKAREDGVDIDLNYQAPTMERVDQAVHEK